MDIGLHETCRQYVSRRLSEGWRIVSQEGFNVILRSPEGIIRPVDLRNDVETLRPNAQGTYTEFVYVNDTDHWAAVDEAAADGFTTYLAENCDDTFHTDTYGLPNSGVGAGTINSVKVYVNANEESAGSGNPRIKIAVYTNSALHEGSEEVLASAWTSYDKTWATNPETTNAWTWAEINALEAGVSAKGKIGGVGGDVYVTQVYVEVDYTPVTGIGAQSIRRNPFGINKISAGGG